MEDFDLEVHTYSSIVCREASNRIHTGTRALSAGDTNCLVYAPRDRLSGILSAYRDEGI